MGWRDDYGYSLIPVAKRGPSLQVAKRVRREAASRWLSRSSHRLDFLGQGVHNLAVTATSKTACREGGRRPERFGRPEDCEGGSRPRGGSELYTVQIDIAALPQKPGRS
jgi:hypothetical protein